MTRLHATNTSLSGVLVFVFLARAAAADGSCSLRGEPIMPKTASIYDSPTGGAEIAKFTGTRVPLTVSAFPEGAASRAQVETSGFRVRGYVRPRDLPVYTTRMVPVSDGHVWIADARRVAIIGGGPGRVHVEKSLDSSLSGYFQAWAPCDAVTLSERVPNGYTPAGDARGYVPKRDRLDLYGGPDGTLVTTVERAIGGAQVLFWSTDRAGAFVHVEYHGDVVLDGWVRAGDVSALPVGETMDQLAPPSMQAGAPHLESQGHPKIARASQVVTLRSAASDAAAVIGAIDSGVDVTVLDVVAGWASVLPRTLAMLPAGAGFWVRAKDLGL